MSCHRCLEYVALLAVELGYSVGMLEEPLMAPARKNGHREDLRERVGLEVCNIGLEHRS